MAWKGNSAGGGANIKSVQRGVVTITGTVANATIVAVDMSQSFVKVNVRGDNLDNGGGLVSAKMTSPTNIEFRCFDSGEQPIMDWEVIEYEGIKGVQRGSYVADNAGADTIHDVAITAVDMDKTFVVHSFRWNNVGSASNVGYWYTFSSTLLDATTLRLISGRSTSQYMIIEWQVIEF